MYFDSYIFTSLLIFLYIYVYNSFLIKKVQYALFIRYKY